MSNLATDLDGQGENLNKLIASAAGTVQLLAEKGNDLGQLNGTLAQLTGTLDTDTGQIEDLIKQYDTVSTTVAQHSGQLNDAITQLSQASSGLVTLLVPNIAPLEADVGTVTTVGRTLDRNLSNVDEILQNGNNLFHGAQRAYDSNYNWLDLNLAAGAGRHRRLPGRLCCATGWPASAVAWWPTTRAGCRRRCSPRSPSAATRRRASSTRWSTTSPASSTRSPGRAAPPRRSRCSKRGSSRLRKATQGAGSTTTTAPPAASAPKSVGSGSTTTTTVPPTTTTTTQPCNLLTELLGCKPASSSGSSSSSSTKSQSSSGGLGGLLSKDVTSATQKASLQTATPATSATATATPATPNPDPTLTAPAAALLPPLPQSQGRSHRSHHAQPGLLSQWGHDVASWF